MTIFHCIRNNNYFTYTKKSNWKRKFTRTDTWRSKLRI